MAISTDATNLSGVVMSQSERTDPPATTVATSVEVVNAPWDIATKRTAVIFLIIAGVGVLWISRPAIPLLVVSGIVAYLLSPIVDFCERLLIPRSVSTIILFVLVLVGLILLPVFLTPILLQQLQTLSDFDVNRTAALLLAWVAEQLARLPDDLQIFGMIVPMNHIVEDLQTNFQQMIVIPTLAEIFDYIQRLIGTATTLVSSTASLGLTLVGGIVQTFIALIVTFFLSLYLTKDAPLIRAYVQGLFPRSYQSEFVELLRHISYIWQSFFRGQLILCFTVGIITGLSLQVVGMPGALILGIVAGSLEIIPSLGPTLSMIPAVIVALIQGSDVLAVYGISNLGFAMITVAIYFIIQQLENSIIVPRVIGNSVNLHPVVVICGVVIGFNLAGVWGAFFAAPVIASCRVVGGYVHAKLLDYPPFQGQRLPPMRPRQPFIYRRQVKGG
jgi:predicted PurR-regulated permease PerM